MSKSKSWMSNQLKIGLSKLANMFAQGIKQWNLLVKLANVLHLLMFSMLGEWPWELQVTWIQAS